MAHVGKDPLTWSFVKLFARQITQELVEFEGIPGSHAWKWRHNGLWRARLFTKAQVVGVLVSIQERAERVEFLVDDGTALIKAVRWSSVPWEKCVALGDLVHVEGKLNMDKSWNDGAALDREIRVVRISKVDDPNEELLHWVDTMELSRSVYSANPTTSSSSSSSSSSSNSIETERICPSSSSSPRIGLPHRAKSKQSSSLWDQIAVDAFFQLAVDADTKARFLGRERSEMHDELLVTTLEELLNEQTQRLAQAPVQVEPRTDNASSDSNAVRVAFIDTLETILQRHVERPLPENSRAKTIGKLRKTFAALRSAGLLFLEDDDSDRHVLLSFEFALKPALLQILQAHDSGMSVVELTEWVVTQRKFQRLPLAWLEISLCQLLRDKQVTQKEDSQRFHLVHE